MPWMRAGLVALAVAVAAYGALLAVLFMVQRDLIYHPGPARAPPAPDDPAVQAVRIATGDGETLTGWFRPAQAGRPVFLYLGGNADRLAGQTARWRRIAQAGAGFLAIAWRGYDGSSGRPSEAGLHQDAQAAWDWLAARADPADIVIHGVSLGTGPAARLAMDRPARAVILEAPYSSMTDLARGLYPFVPVGLLLRDTYRTMDWIGHVDAPVLIVHGAADRDIPFSHGEAVFAAASSPKRLVRMEGADHHTLVRDGLYDHVWRFLDAPFSGTTAFQGRPADYRQTDLD